MDRQAALSELRQCAEEIRAFGATSLYLYGSTSRDGAVADSDIDLFIDYDLGSKFSLVELVGLKQFLEDRLDTAVDLTTRDSLHPMLRRKIALKVF